MRIIAFLLMLFVWVGCQSESESAFRTANKKIGSKNPLDWQKSIVYYRQSIELEIKARYKLAKAYKKIAKRYLKEAGYKLSEEQILNQTKRNAKIQLAAGLNEFGIYNSAVSNLLEAKKIRPVDKDVYYYLGVSYSQLSRAAKDDGQTTLLMGKASEAYRQAIKIDPEYTKAMYGLSMLHLYAKQYDAAVKLLNRVIVLKPKGRKAYFALARTYYGQGKFRKAESIYQMLLEIISKKDYRRKIIKRNLKKLRSM